MARVYTATERPFDDVAHAGIVITCLRERRGQQHVGILHKDESTGEVKVLHLAWHYDLRNSPPSPNYAWVNPAIPRKRLRQVAAQCRKIKRENEKGLPYSFGSPGDCFDKQTGKYLKGPNHRGLTCASFVLAVFHDIGLPLIQYETWPESRDGDEQWKLHIIEQLKEDGASDEHIRDVESEKEFVRYRPEDVAGAGAAHSVPAPYMEVQRLAQDVLQKLHENDLFT
jgi:hypothetical protein